MLKLRFLTFTFLLFTMFPGFAQHLAIDEIRRDFKIGHKDKERCQQHLSQLESHANSAVERGYEAAYRMFMAKHTSNPFKKMGYFKNGKKMLEETIDSDEQNAELRYIRLCIQYYVPSYLGYKDDIQEDKEFLMNNLYKLEDDSVKSLIFNYLKGAKMYSEEELKLLGR